MEQCERCPRRAVVAWSCAAGAVVCEACHCAAAPPIDPAALRLRPPPRPRPPKPSARAQLVERVWRALEAVGTVFYLGPGLVAGWCPACRAGTLLVRFIDADPPRLRLDGCSGGCSPGEVAKTFR